MAGVCRRTSGHGARPFCGIYASASSGTAPVAPSADSGRGRLFMPFAALKGFEELIEGEARDAGRQVRREASSRVAGGASRGS